MNPTEPREPEPSFGADEEGEAPLDEGAVTEDADAWVSKDPPGPPSSVGIAPPD